MLSASTRFWGKFQMGLAHAKWNRNLVIPKPAANPPMNLLQKVLPTIPRLSSSNNPMAVLFQHVPSKTFPPLCNA